MNKSNCKFFEQLLLQQETEPFNGPEKEQLDAHLRSCPRCAAFRRTLLGLAHEAAFERDPAGDPGKHVLNQLQQTLRESHQRVSLPETLWVRFRQLLTCRIPVYQAAFAGVVIFVLFLAYSQLSKMTEQEQSASFQFAGEQNISLYPDSALQQLQSIQKQTGGRNAREDSALTRFLISM